MINLLALSWCGLIAFGVVMYVLLGGCDLGVGILSIFLRNEHERSLAISAILPVWDGNQTWLVFGGAALYGAFPLAFSTILPLMYMPLFIMVIALLFRGIAFEFRLKAIKTKFFWDICLFAGSLFAVIAQGLILGTFVKGFAIGAGASNASYPWFNAFGIFCALGLICGYSLLAINYLIIKTTGALQLWCFKMAGKLQYFILLGVIIVSIWSPFLDPAIYQRWFNPHYMFYLAILPITAGLLFYLHWYGIRSRREYLPFWSAMGMFLTCYIGLIISIYPYIVPRHITYLQAAASESSLLFMLVGAIVMLPPLLWYTYYSYKIFRGKVIEILGYH